MDPWARHDRDAATVGDVLQQLAGPVTVAWWAPRGVETRVQQFWARVQPPGRAIVEELARSVSTLGFHNRSEIQFVDHGDYIRSFFVAARSDDGYLHRIKVMVARPDFFDSVPRPVADEPLVARISLFPPTELASDVAPMSVAE